MSEEHNHSHSHLHDHGVDDTPIRLLLLVLLINTLFFLVELAGAFIAGSLTLFADAMHMLTDSLSIILALFAAWVGKKSADRIRTYGYHRAEVLAGFLNGVFLLVVAVFVFVDAYRRVQSPVDVNAEIVIIVGFIGLIANSVAALLLVRSRDNINVRAVFLHLAVDAGSSLAVVGGGVMMLFTGSRLIDPVLAVLIAVLVLASVLGLLRESINILLQGTPKDIDLDRVRERVGSVDSVIDVHDLHMWSLDSNTYTCSLHIVVGRENNITRVRKEVEDILCTDFDCDHTTIQVEVEGSDCYLDVNCYTVEE